VEITQHRSTILDKAQEHRLQIARELEKVTSLQP